MTRAVVAHTNLAESVEAGNSLGLQIAERFSENPDVVLLFIAPSYDQAAVLAAVKNKCHPEILLGCSSAGEFTSHVRGDGLACAVALHAEGDMLFSAGIGRGVQGQYSQAAREVARAFRHESHPAYTYRSALVLADALVGHTENLLGHLTYLTHGTHQFFGGGAGDNAQFQATPVFYGTEVVSDAAVALEILSKKPVGIGARHGWRPISKAMQVTEARGKYLCQLDGRPAADVFLKYVQATEQQLDVANMMPLLLHNLLGIDFGIGYKLRVPLAVQPDGSILYAAEIPPDATVHFMQTSSGSAEKAAIEATHIAQQKLYGSKPAVALFFDCVATRLRMGREFGFELQSVQDTLGDVEYLGCNTHGQIARTEGQLCTFHNCTAVVCLLPA